LTAVLALVGNLFYVVVYTGYLKRSTDQNIVIGGAAGAAPPLVGYAPPPGGSPFCVVVCAGYLKPPPHQNIVIGGAAGAAPPLVGYAAATGSLALPALWLFLIVFLWTPPHFWALALLLKNAYARA